MEIVSIEELRPGDTILIDGMEENETLVVTVSKVLEEDELIIPAELGGMDYSPPNPYLIVRLAQKGDDVTVNFLSDSISWK